MDRLELENELREVESKLEEIGRSICSVDGGSDSWRAINCAIVKVQDAIHSTYKIEA